MTVALEVTGLKKSFGGVTAVRGIDFSVAAGESVALIGPNGAGKTTSFNLVNGQLLPDEGRVMLYGDDITRMQPEALFRMGVARTFQISATFGSMTVRENVQMALISHARGATSLLSWASRQHVDHASSLLADVGLAEQSERLASELAYGDLKRLELAVALAGKPRLLLLDEPTAGMAASERLDSIRTVHRIAKQLGLTVVFTEHDMQVVFSVADRISVLHQGAIIADDAPEAIRRSPQVQQVYLGETVEEGTP